MTPLLPGPGSYLEQDAELMLAFEILEEIMADIERGRQAREKNQHSAAQLGQVSS